MKIAVIGPVYPFRGGIAHYNHHLCKELAKRHEIKQISFKRLYPRILFPGRHQREKGGSYLPGVSYAMDTLNPLSWLCIAGYILRTRPSLVIIHWWTTFLAIPYMVICFLIRKKTKILFLCHNVLPHEKRNIDRFMAKIAFNQADFFIVNSRKDLQLLKRLHGSANARLCSHAAYNMFDEHVSEDIRARLGLRDKVILFFGFVRGYKGLGYLIEAMPLILRKVNLDLLIVGEFWNDKKLYLKMIRDLGIGDHVKIVDSYVPNEHVANYFTAADVVVLPYITATQSAVAFVAYNFNKPVITTNVGGLPETVVHNKTGFIVNPCNSRALAEAVVAFYHDKKSGEFVRNIKRMKGDWSSIVKAIEDLSR